MRKQIQILVAIILKAFPVFSQHKDYAPMLFNATYTSDFGKNFTGGIQKGDFYLGQINMSLTIPTFKNSEFYFQLQNTHGSTPTANLTGDLQSFSNIENGDYTYLYMAYYKQTIGRVSATLGFHDLNSMFYVTEFGHFFLNSSFGIQPSASMNMPVSIFPKNALGLVVNYKLSDRLSAQTSLYDGDPGTFNNDPYNIKPSIDYQNQGLFSASEIHYQKLSPAKNTGMYKLGFQYHTANFVRFADSTSQSGNYGVYLIADQYVRNNIGVFLQLGWSPSSTNMDTFYSGIGATIFGIGHRVNDQFGMAVSYVLLSNHYCKNYSSRSYNYEANIEVTYKFQTNKYISLQPDIQYILNPGGTLNYADALVAMMRLNINI